ncbi:uncharacterized protein LOC131641187 [Vicia villosa]|uniref:uncharacterized protein LOC131641187 n=1 Tax=Vicia villosa TaxID=3911 RepID=UPI00273AA548|nr:uncharacterized protein LOC131641187 [Vicia villosa]
MIASEIIHYLKRKTHGRRAQLALKIDISKAYDRVDWGFLRSMMLKMGFSEKWTHWMMMCVMSVHYSVLVNSDTVGPIMPGRGLRQGDPLSPYLFILVSEGLSTLIKGSVARGDIHGIQICRGAPSVLHLLFADDYFLFCRANVDEVYHLMEVLDIYAKASSQEINLTKSEVFFSRNLSLPAQEDLANIMGVRHVLGTCKYLGFPSMIGRSKKSTFAFIKDRIWQRINSWKGRSLSKAGKEVMIKSVLQAIPAYVMSIFILPEAVINDIERMLNAFWWGGGSISKGICWMAWDRLACSKKDGGLGFIDFRAFNMAMVAKQGWFIMSHPQSLVSRFFKARYFPKTSFFEANLGSNPSFVWRSIWKARDVLMLGCRWSIGDGSQIKVIQEPWIRGKYDRCVPGPQQHGIYNLVVKDLLLPNVKQWNMRLIREQFDFPEAEAITYVPLVEDVVVDRLVWREEKDGQYSVCSGYHVWKSRKKPPIQENIEVNWNGLWSIIAPPRVKHLLWRICSGCLPSRVRLRQHHVPCPIMCQFCWEEEEDDWHVFFGCPETIECWRTAGLYDIIASLLLHSNDIRSLILNLCNTEDTKVAGRFAMMIELLWHNRNAFIWNNKKKEVSRLGWLAFHKWQEWWLAQNPQDGEAALPSTLSWIPPLPVGLSVMLMRVLIVTKELLIEVGVSGITWGILLKKVLLGMLVRFLSKVL